jgi:hypothetical protein
MRLLTPSLRSSLAVVTGILVTAMLVLAFETTIVIRANGVATIQMMKLIWVLDVLAGMFGGYVTALIAAHSPVRHAMAVAGLFLLPITVLGFLSSEPLLQILITSLGFAMCVLLGAIGRDWQRQRSRGCPA